jgi:Flp pilus assembly CpaE family ATPase
MDPVTLGFYGAVCGLLAAFVPSASRAFRFALGVGVGLVAAAETIVLPVNPEISALKSVHGLLEYLTETGSIGSKATFVLNNVFAREILKPRDIESALGTKITLDLPYDAFLYLKAVNEGVPIVIGAPRSAAAEQFVKLTSTAFAVDGFTVPEEPPRRVGLFGRRRR